MTKQLSKTFGFETDDTDDEDIDNTDIEISHEKVMISSEDDQILEDSGISEHESEMNQIFSIALDAHKKTMEYGFGVEPKNASSGLSASTSFLNIALNASKSKVDKKMSLLRLKELKNQKTEGKVDTNSSVDEENINPEDNIIGDVMDRNSLMDEIKNMIDQSKK